MDEKLRDQLLDVWDRIVTARDRVELLRDLFCQNRAPSLDDDSVAGIALNLVETIDCLRHPIETLEMLCCPTPSIPAEKGEKDAHSANAY